MPKELSLQRKQFAYQYVNGEKAYNATQSAILAEYSPKTAKQQGQRLLTFVDVKQEIARLEAEKRVEIEHNYNIAITELNQVIANLKTKALAGDIQANQALTAAIREKNAITGLHKQEIKHRTEPMPERSQAEQQALTDLARNYKLRLAEGA